MKYRKASCLVLSLLLVCGAFGMAGCSKSSSKQVPAVNETTAGSGSQKSDGASKKQEGSAETAAPAMTEAWMPVKVSFTEPEENNLFDFELSYDESGRICSAVILADSVGGIQVGDHILKYGKYYGPDYTDAEKTRCYELNKEGRSCVSSIVGEYGEDKGTYSLDEDKKKDEVRLSLKFNAGRYTYNMTAPEDNVMQLSSGGEVFTFTYEAGQRTVTYSDWDNSGSPLKGEIQDKEYPDKTSALSYSYGEDGRVNSYKFGSSSKSYTYEMDADGKITSVSMTGSMYTDRYEMYYNDEGHLYKVENYHDWGENDKRYKGTELFGYEYDENGNIVKVKIYAYDRIDDPQVNSVDEKEEDDLCLYQVEYAKMQVPEGTVDGYRLARIVSGAALTGSGSNFWY